MAKRIKMLRNDRGSEDGCHVLQFLEGQEYDVGDELAEAFVVHRKSAEEVAAKGKPAVAKTTDGEDAPKPTKDKK